MRLGVDWTPQAWTDVSRLHWRTTGNVCRAVNDFAEDGIGTLRRLPPDERKGATHALFVPPFKVYVSLDRADSVVRVWRVLRYVS